ncbi:MAG: chorismate mutase [Planctomycetaceae bacterium]|jgi:monofunctional chorismate mutase
MSTEKAMRVRGVRGATTASANTREAVLEATRELLQEILKLNQIDDPEDIASILFTTTPDLTATFPAEAAREIGLQLVPLLCASEIAVPGRLTSCIRVMLHLNTTKSLAQIIHVYLREAKSLRPDIHSAQ